MRVVAGPFVGRERELERVRAALAPTTGNAARFVLVSGEAGIGKSRLAEEVAACSDAPVVRAACYPDEWRPALDPWLRVARRLLEDRRSDTPATALLEPEALPALPAGEARYRTYEAFRALLFEHAQPLLVIVDDLHWADAASRELLAYLARSGGNAPVALLATFRESEIDSALLSELLRLNGVEHVALQPLEPATATALVRRLHDRPNADEIAARTGGNPLFITQVVQHVLEGGDLDTVPATLRHTIAARRDRLTSDASQLLGVAVAFRGPFAFDLLEAVAQLGEERTLDAVDELLAARLLRTTADGRYEFEHALIREALYGELNPSRRARLHRRVAESIEALATDVEEHAAELAAQYDASRSLPGAERGIPFGLAAARDAARRGSPELEAELLGMAGRLARDAAPEVRAEIAARRAAAAANAIRIDEALRALEEATGLLRSLGRRSEEAALLQEVARALRLAGADESVVGTLVERGLDLLGETRDLTWARLRLSQRRFEPIEAGPVHAGRWIPHDPEAVAIVEADGDEEDWARTLEPSDYSERAETDALARRVLRCTHPMARMRGLSVLAQVYLFQLGDVAETGRLARMLWAVATEIGSLVGQAHALLWTSEAHFVHGEFEAGNEAYRGARELIARLGPSHTLRRTMGGTSTAHYTVGGDWRWVAEHQRSLATDPRNPPSMSLTQALRSAYGYLWLGELGRAREQIGWVLRPLLDSPPSQMNRNLGVAWAGQLAWELEDAALAAAVREELEPLVAARTLVHAQVTSIDIAHASCATLEGDWEAASRSFDAARLGTGERRERPLRALVDFYDGVSRRRAGRGGADELIGRAASAFEELGMGVWTERVSRLREPAQPDGLTAREAEVLARVAAGDTNKEIAAELVLSVRTVERHVDNAYRKIGVRNRAEATAYALRNDLVA
jgi:DNA-binding CsgD family transcriptional regulator